MLKQYSTHVLLKEYVRSPIIFVFSISNEQAEEQSLCVDFLKFLGSP